MGSSIPSARPVATMSIGMATELEVEQIREYLSAGGGHCPTQENPSRPRAGVRPRCSRAAISRRWGPKAFRLHQFEFHSA